MWSIGIILYVLLSGYMPFQGQTCEEIFDAIRQGHIHFEHEEFKYVSDEGIDLVKRLIKVCPEERLSAEEALQHPWFQIFRENESDTTQHNEEFEHALVDRLKQYRGVSHLKRASINLLVKMTN